MWLHYNYAQGWLCNGKHECDWTDKKLAKSGQDFNRGMTHVHYNYTMWSCDYTIIMHMDDYATLVNMTSLDPRPHYHQGSGPGIDCLRMR